MLCFFLCYSLKEVQGSRRQMVTLLWIIIHLCYGKQAYVYTFSRISCESMYIFKRTDLCFPLTKIHEMYEMCHWKFQLLFMLVLSLESMTFSMMGKVYQERAPRAGGVGGRPRQAQMWLIKPWTVGWGRHCWMLQCEGWARDLIDFLCPFL